MSLETEAILDRRRLRRHLSLWRVAAVVAGVLAFGALIFKGVGGRAFSERQIARVNLEGIITENRDQLKLLREIARDKSVEAVLLFINSPGGTTTGGEALFEAIRGVAAKKPVVAQFGTVATSAAYIAGLATDRIVARGNTITGSVGVIFQWAEVTELLSKLGVKMNEIKSGPLKANPSPFQPVDEAGRQTAQQMVAESMRWFVGLVASRRSINTADVPGLEQGRVYSGREALEYKLIDQIGGEREAQAWLEEKRGITKGLKIVDWKPRRDDDWNLIDLFTKSAAKLAGISAAKLLELAADDPRLALLRLDGLVSVWQPSEN
jgi:protease IV